MKPPTCTFRNKKNTGQNPPENPNFNGSTGGDRWKNRYRIRIPYLAGQLGMMKNPPKKCNNGHCIIRRYQMNQPVSAAKKPKENLEMSSKSVHFQIGLKNLILMATVCTIVICNHVFPQPPKIDSAIQILWHIPKNSVETTPWTHRCHLFALKPLPLTSRACRRTHSKDTFHFLLTFVGSCGSNTLMNKYTQVRWTCVGAQVTWRWTCFLVHMLWEQREWRRANHIEANPFWSSGSTLEVFCCIWARILLWCMLGHEQVKRTDDSLTSPSSSSPLSVWKTSCGCWSSKQRLFSCSGPAKLSSWQQRSHDEGITRNKRNTPGADTFWAT